MIPILDTKGMQEADRVTIKDLGLPSMVLMEQAARAVTDTVTERFPEREPVVVLCGPGNNGGDGLAVARQLHVQGVEVEAALLVEPERLNGDARTQLDLVRRFGVPLTRPAPEEVPAVLAGAGVVVDALFGTGLTRPLEEPWAGVVTAVNRTAAPVVAVDIPSGLAGGSSLVPGVAVEAAITVTFGAPKVAQVLPPACWHCGEVAVADIGIPPWLLAQLATLEMVERRDVEGWLPTRLPDAHKGHFGHLVIVAGRFGRSGAAALAARAAVAAGAGLVTVATPRSAVNAVQSLVPEAMVDGLAEDGEGVCTGEGLAPLLAKATAVAAGPGLGLGEGPERLVMSLLADWQGPLLLDADALSLLAGRLHEVRGAGATVLTPHPGELGRMLNIDSSQVVANRVECACQAAEASGAVVVAKGARTVVASPGGQVRLIPVGGPGLASGGSGDVLTGVVGALLAQGLTAEEAGAAGAYVHGLAGDLAAERYPGAVPAGIVAEHVAVAEARVRERG